MFYAAALCNPVMGRSRYALSGVLPSGLEWGRH